MGSSSNYERHLNIKRIKHASLQIFYIERAVTPEKEQRFLIIMFFQVQRVLAAVAAVPAGAALVVEVDVVAAH